jgi:hypothetical protein
MISRAIPRTCSGQFGTAGWWYYFPVALAVQTPIAFLILEAVGLWVCLCERAVVEYLLPIAFCAGILLPAMFGRIDTGLRHIDLIYIGLSVIAALGLCACYDGLRWERLPPQPWCYGRRSLWRSIIPTIWPISTALPGGTRPDSCGFQP